MYDTPWRSVCDQCVFLSAKSRLLQVFIVFIMAISALSDVPPSGTPETFVQLTITPNQPQYYTLKTDNTNELKLRIKVPSKDCVGSITFRSNFIPIPGAPANTNCEALEFVWKETAGILQLVIKGYENKGIISYIDSAYGVNMGVVYNFISPSRNIKTKFEDESVSFLTFPCKLNFSGGVDGLPDYFALTVESKDFPASCNMEIALLGVERYVLPTTTIATTSTTPKPSPEPNPEPKHNPEDEENTTTFSRTTSEHPTIYPSPGCWCDFWLVIFLIIVLFVSVFLNIGCIACSIYLFVKKKRQAREYNRRLKITRAEKLQAIDQQEAAAKDLPLEATEEESVSVNVQSLISKPSKQKDVDKTQYESEIPRTPTPIEAN